MNDFTKEELEIILLDMNFYAKNKRFKCLVEAHGHVKCREKIQSLIDNYCDHIYTDGSGNMLFCAKCQAYGGKR